jgi:hypothetical protein
MAYDILDVVVKRSEWLRGNGNGLLINRSGQKCCLGFACIAAGENPGNMLNHGTPNDLLDEISAPQHLLRFLKWDDEGSLDNDVTNELVHINDDELASDEERERSIATLGRSIDINFTFVD